jgi:hypothetical protein
MPTGENRALAWNALTAKWEGRFYAPRTLRDGRTVLGLRVVRANGTSSRFTLNLAFDSATAKTHGMKQATVAGIEMEWRLGLWSQGPTQRVSALLPWQERVELPAQPSGQFAARSAVPSDWRGKKARVQFLVVSQSREMTKIIVDWN